MALKRLGPMAKRVLPTVLNRMDRVYEMQRAKGDDFLLGYFEKINAPSEIATLFLKGIDAGELKTKDGVLAKLFVG